MSASPCQLARRCGDTPSARRYEAGHLLRPGAVTPRSPIQWSANIVARRTSISHRAHELTCKEASCSPVDVYWRQSHGGICTGGGATEPLHTSVPIGCQDNQTHLLRQPLILLFWNLFACLRSLIARIGNFEARPRRCSLTTFVTRERNRQREELHLF